MSGTLPPGTRIPTPPKCPECGEVYHIEYHMHQCPWEDRHPIDCVWKWKHHAVAAMALQHEKDFARERLCYLCCGLTFGSIITACALALAWSHLGG